MISYFIFKEEIRVKQKAPDCVYEHIFEAAPTTDIPFDKIYFSTFSDFHRQLDNIKKQINPDKISCAALIDPKQIESTPKFPVNIGFGNLLNHINKFKKPELKIAIVNAISNGIGDFLVGSRAFEIWYDYLQQLLPETKLNISFFQFNPYGLNSLTKQLGSKVNHVHLLPSRLSVLMEHDAYIDLGTLIINDDFNNKPMIDFFLKAFSVDPETISSSEKRIHYTVPKESKSYFQHITSIIRSKNRPLLLFHNRSTTSIREMNDVKTRQVIKQIIENSEYFVVSLSKLDYCHKRFIDLSNYSSTIDDFAAIVSMMDGVITVDTSTYHLADAFSVPSVVLFTTIDPDLRIRYYPLTDGILLDKGMLYGRHKEVIDPEQKKIEDEYINKLWDKLDIIEVLGKLDSLRKAVCQTN